MQTGNIKTMAVAAVAIVICLLFSWVYLDDDPVEMRYAEVGDYVVFDCVYSYDYGDVEHTMTAVVVGEDEAGNQTVQWAYDDGEPFCEPQDGNLVSNDMGEIIGTETVDSPYFGEVECNVYLQPDGSLAWNLVGSNALVMDYHEYDEYALTRMVVDTSLFGDVPEFGHSVEKDTVAVGDYYVYSISEYDNNGTLLGSHTEVVVVYTVEGDQVTYGPLGSDERTTGTVDEFIDHLSPPSNEGYIGQYLLENPTYGYRMCDIFEFQRDGYIEQVYVGEDDGVFYETVDYFDQGYVVYQLIYSTLMAGDIEASSPMRNAEIGYEYISSSIDSGDGEWTVVRQTVVVTEVLEDTCVMDIYQDGEFMATYEGDFFVDSGETPEPVSSSEVLTPWGALEIDVIVQTLEDGSTIVNFCPEHMDASIATIVADSLGDVHVSVLMQCSMLEIA